MRHLVKDLDKNMQQIVGNLLRAGVIISITIVFIGGILYLTADGSLKINYAAFSPGVTPTIKSILINLKSLSGEAVIQFGILVLIFTPIARILLAVVSFQIEKDYLYVGIGLLVFSIIMLSLSAGFTH